jgi:hypothetical protein
MPRRSDLHSIMVIGSGPIVIGQACEFDYSGTQACKALRREGFHVSLVNSNPATIMTDPQFADRTYIEPLDPASVLAVLERERPDALLPTLGGQTGLNVAVALAESGDLDRLGIRLIGASLEAIHRAEDRSGFKRTMLEAGLEVPRAAVAHTLDEALTLADRSNVFGRASAGCMREISIVPTSLKLPDTNASAFRFSRAASRPTSSEPPRRPSAVHLFGHGRRRALPPRARRTLLDSRGRVSNWW